MNIENARRLLAEIPNEATVVDVGGGASPFPRADYVIDALPFDAMGGGSDGNAHQHLSADIRYSPQRWIQIDMCDRTPWPVPDKMFDFAICSHLLEDVRDPIWICAELSRIARAGYIEVPSRIVEQSMGIENPRHAGYYHHRWLITRSDNRLEFRMKPHVLHSTHRAIVARLWPGSQINPKYSIVTLDWKDRVDATEVLEFHEGAVIRELCDFAATARKMPDLTVKVPMSITDRLKRNIYRFRQSRGNPL